MMSWNKEKLTFAASVVVAALVIASTIPAWRGGAVELTLTAPRTATNVPLGPVRIPWFERQAGDESRDPFARVSSWRSAAADPLPDPPVGSLMRRVPLPEPLARTERARPIREESAPTQDNGGEDQ